MFSNRSWADVFNIEVRAPKIAKKRCRATREKHMVVNQLHKLQTDPNILEGQARKDGRVILLRTTGCSSLGARTTTPTLSTRTGLR